MTADLPAGDGTPRAPALAPNREGLPAFVRALPFAALVCDEQGRILLANDRLAALFGWPAGELAGQSVESLVPVGLRSGHEAQRRGFQEGPSSRSMAGRAVAGMRRDGGEILVEVGLSTIEHAGGRVALAAVGDLSDRIERERMENVSRVLRERTQELARRESELEILAHDADGLVVVTKDRRVLWCNPAAAGLIGVRAGGDCRFPVEPRAGETVEIPIEAGPSRQTWVECRMSPLTWQGEDAILASLRDTTARRQLEEERQASRSAWILGQLAGTVAHGFNNAAMAILGAVEQAREAKTAEDAERHLGEIRDAAERSAALTRRLLALSGTASSGARLIDAAGAIRAIEPALRRVGQDRNRIDVHVPDEPLPVRLEPGELEQIALSLAVNAVEACSDSGTVVVRLAAIPAGAPLPCGCGGPRRPSGPAVVLEVTDSGVGIEEEILPRIFEPFFSTKQGANSAGLGLAAVAAITNRMGGHACASSRPGRGTTLRVQFPRAEEPVEPATEAAPGRSAGNGRPLRVMVVDDEEVIRRFVARHLVGRGFEVLTAGSGREALDLRPAWGGCPDLLLTDVVMPEMDGVELAEAMRARDPSTRVLFMSGYSADALRRHSLDPEQVDLLAKPFRLAALDEAIAAILGRAPLR